MGEAASKESSRKLKEAKEKFEYFWLKKDVFSQWYPCKFKIDGQKYNCAEQYMMQQKALIYGDSEAAKIIMSTSDPSVQKKTARKAADDSQLSWIESGWDDKCVEVVKKGNLAKFGQNPKLKERLFASYPKILVEASPYDKKWGIGLAETDPQAWDQSTWQGKNLLGSTLGEVREILMKQDGKLDKKKKKS